MLLVPLDKKMLKVLQEELSSVRARDAMKSAGKEVVTEKYGTVSSGATDAFAGLDFALGAARTIFQLRFTDAR